MIECKDWKETIQKVRNKTDTVILSFSRGRDSIASYLAIKDKFPNLLLVHFYYVPHLKFMDDSIRYYEQALGQRIIQLPHPFFYKWWTTLTFQAPENSPIVVHTLDDFIEGAFDAGMKNLCEFMGVNYKEVYQAIGLKKADSLFRRQHIGRVGSICKNRHFYPVWDWSHKDCYAAIREAGLHLPVDYAIFGRTFDGLDAKFTLPLKRYFPEDYRRLLLWFPMVEAETKRYEIWQKRTLN